MTIVDPNLLDFYRQQGPMSDPGKYAGLMAGLPTDLASLCRVVQHNLIHVFWAEKYGRNLSNEEKGPLNLRRLSHKLALARQIDGRPLVNERPVEKRQVGNCRDYSLLLTAFLRQQGVAARARCGFGAYFLPNHYEDHWVCEYWNSQEGRWVLVDAQLDGLQRKAMSIPFDPLDVPRDQFIVAGQAWQMCRAGEADPTQFGVLNMNGWWFIWGDVARDFLSLNKVTILAWDHEVSVFTHKLEDPPPEDPEELTFLDRIAALTLSGDPGFDAIRTEFEHPRWKTPREWYE
ncbi:transglutaminase domain-containing protein [Chloroflexota bacterium]